MPRRAHFFDPAIWTVTLTLPLNSNQDIPRILHYEQGKHGLESALIAPITRCLEYV